MTAATMLRERLDSYCKYNILYKDAFYRYIPNLMQTLILCTVKTTRPNRCILTSSLQPLRLEVSSDAYNLCIFFALGGFTNWPESHPNSHCIFITTRSNHQHLLVMTIPWPFLHPPCWHSSGKSAIEYWVPIEGPFTCTKSRDPLWASAMQQTLCITWHFFTNNVVITMTLFSALNKWKTSIEFAVQV